MGCSIKEVKITRTIQTNCSKCNRKAVILLQHGSLCDKHFLNYFEDKVFKTIKKYRMLGREEKICVAASGGKDSTAALYLTKRFFQDNNYNLKNLFALLIDEGITTHRDGSLRNLEKFCRKEKITLKIVNIKDHFKMTLDEAAPKLRKAGRKPCMVCGIWRRYLLNKQSRELGAVKLVTGHNLDDEAQSIIMNTFKANTSLAANLGPISGTKEHELFVRRIKPLYLCTNEEVELYTKIKKWELDYCDCVYAEEGYRFQIKKMLNDFEEKYPGTKQGIINSYLDLLPLLKQNLSEKINRGEIKICQECNEPANGEICNACKLAKEIVGN